MDKVYFYIILILGIIYLFNKYYKKDNSIVLKDNMDGMVGANTSEGQPLNSDYEKAWTDENITINTKNHTADIRNEKTNTGGFFNKNNEYVDITSYKSKDIIPEKCLLENGVLNCKFNDKLQNIPPKLIENPESNPVILSIGDDKDMNTNKLSAETFSFNGNSYNVWDNETPSEVYDGYNNDSTPLDIKNLKRSYTL